MTEPPKREVMPSERGGSTFAFRLQQTGVDGQPETVRLYFTINQVPDGRVGEVFIRADKQGGFMSGVLDVLGIMISLGLQHGVPLDVIIQKMKDTRFPPASFTGNNIVPNCSSPLDLLARLLEAKFSVHEPSRSG